MRKKLLAMALAVTMVIGLTACGGKGNEGKGPDKPSGEMKVSGETEEVELHGIKYKKAKDITTENIELTYFHFDQDETVQYLANHPQVEKVNHPLVSADPEQAALYAKYFPGGGGSIFTFEIKGDARKAKEFIDNLELFSLLANVADVKSLVIHPASTTHSQLTEEELLEQGIKPNTIRLSIGTENTDDIIEDLQAAFEAVK